MINVGDKVKVLDTNGLPYKKVADIGYVTAIDGDRVFVSILMHRSSPYFPLEFDVNRCVSVC